MVDFSWTANIPALRGGSNDAAARMLPKPSRGAACILGVAALLLPGGLPVAAFICMYRYLRARAEDRRKLGA
jgi:hypothetical protein